jgi:hypothetical protein
MNYILYYTMTTRQDQGAKNQRVYLKKAPEKGKIFELFNICPIKF